MKAPGGVGAADAGMPLGEGHEAPQAEVAPLGLNREKRPPLSGDRCANQRFSRLRSYLSWVDSA